MKGKVQNQRILKELGLRLKEARTRRRFTLPEIAKRISVSERSYKRIEAGEGSVGIGRYIEAALILDIDFSKTFSELLKAQKKKGRRQQKISSDEVDF